MRSLLLVRHPRPLAEPNVPTDRWGLGAEGLHAAFALGDHLPPFTTSILSSTAPVAAQSARAMAGARGHDIAVLLDDRLDEIAGPRSPDVEDAAAVEYYLDGGRISSWEHPADAVARFSTALLAAQQPHLRATAIVTHGVILALWLGPRLGMNPRQVWRQLSMPDLWRYDPGTNAVSRVPGVGVGASPDPTRRAAG